MCVWYFALLADLNKVQCHYCTKWIHKDSIKRHIRNRHEIVETVSCDICGSIFKNVESMKFHFNKFHKDQVELLWTISWSFQLNIIIVIIVDKIPCPVCNVCYHKSSLKRHIKNQHEGAETASCSICGLTLKNEGILKDHMRRKHNAYQTF